MEAEAMVAAFYGIVSATLVTASYIGMVMLRRQSRSAMLQVKPFRHLRLRPGR